MKSCTNNSNGWIGGFAQKFPYPNPDLSSLPLLGNMDNINLLTRQQKVCWPEFSWQTALGDEGSRCFQMFSPDISRIGYTDKGRIYSIICPQQGIYHPHWGALNIEVTVTGQRGWADEKAKELTVAADLTAEGQIWFSPAARQSGWAQFFWILFSSNGLPFPDSKANSIKVTLHNSADKTKSILPGRSGESPRFTAPDFARHPDEAWAVANLEVRIGKIKSTGNGIVDDFNQLVMEAFNLASGNLLTPGNTLTWNVWFECPTLVDQEEWRDHAERWRKSIDEGHGSPTGPGHPPRYSNGNPFSVADTLIEEAIDDIIAWLKKHLGDL